MDVLHGIEPDLGRYQGHQRVPVRPQSLNSDAFSLQVGDRADPFMREELETADMHAGEQRDGLAGIDRPDVV